MTSDWRRLYIDQSIRDWPTPILCQPAESQTPRAARGHSPSLQLPWPLQGTRQTAAQLCPRLPRRGNRAGHWPGLVVTAPHPGPSGPRRVPRTPSSVRAGIRATASRSRWSLGAVGSGWHLLPCCAAAAGCPARPCQPLALRPRAAHLPPRQRRTQSAAPTALPGRDRAGCAGRQPLPPLPAA
ncbi:MAG: hypothetical protein BWY85_01072 [Firmicutes bacterium ADurb.Bin506]|nr:MAG: hypothetical protein BWY85_01072 [Firmicutes bacterium ADurb.Bin506]